MEGDSTNNYIIGGLAIAVIGLGVYLFTRTTSAQSYEHKSTGKSETKSDNGRKAPTGFKSLETSVQKEYTIEEIAKHNTKDDCWIIVDTFVYDLSSFVMDHPGEIEPLVKRSGPGQDATVGFRGSQHISTVEDQIKQYLIGHIQEYALAEIAKHNTKEDCWIILNHKVYDVTKFIPDHPGGDAILRNAGKDSTAGFSKVGAHKKKAAPDDNYSKAEETMGKYLIGAVKRDERVLLKKDQ